MYFVKEGAGVSSDKDYCYRLELPRPCKGVQHGDAGYPLIFMKPPTAVIGNGETILYPPQTKELHYEG